jgi:hypothetical protein
VIDRPPPLTTVRLAREGQRQRAEGAAFRTPLPPVAHRCRRQAIGEKGVTLKRGGFERCGTPSAQNSPGRVPAKNG